MRHEYFARKKLSVTAINKVENGIQLKALVNLPLPIVREKTGSAELRMSRDTLFAMIWNETENDISPNWTKYAAGDR